MIVCGVKKRIYEHGAKISACLTLTKDFIVYVLVVVGLPWLRSGPTSAESQGHSPATQWRNFGDGDIV
jgi:hypothetical protein